MSRHPEYALRTVARWGGRTIITLARVELVYDLLVCIAARLAPPGKSRRKLARKFNCDPAMVPDALVCYAAIYALVGLTIMCLTIMLLLRALVMIFAD